MGSPDPCQSEEDEVTRLTQEVFRLQKELNWVNDEKQGKVLDDLKAKEAAGEKGHKREIGEIESSINKLNKEIQKAADALGEAEKKRDACRAQQRQPERQQGAQIGGGQTR